MSVDRRIPVAPEVQAVAVYLIGAVAGVGILQTRFHVAILVTAVLVAAFAAFVLRRGDEHDRLRRREEMGLRRPSISPARIALLCTIAAFLPVALTLVSDWLFAARAVHGNPALASDHAASRLLALIVILPFSEELAFRGLLLRSLCRRIGAIPAVAASALLFAVMHGSTVLIRITSSRASSSASPPCARTPSGPPS